MEKVLSDYFGSFNVFTISALLMMFLTIGSFLDQNAFAQTSSGEFLYQPAIDALTTFSTGVAESAPKIIAAVILLIIGLIVGKVIGKVIEKSSIKFLDKVNKNESNNDGLAQTTSTKNSSKLIAASVRWFVYLFFIIAAINALEFEQLSMALTDLWLWVPNLLAFILIIIIGMIIANFIGKWLDQELIKQEYGGSKYVTTGVKVIIYAVIFAIALTQLGVGETIIPILVSSFSWSIAAGIGAAIAIGLGFTFRDMFPAIINSASKQRSVIKVGQKIQVGENKGIITSVDLLHIILVNENNESVVIPTKNISDQTIRIFGENVS